MNPQETRASASEGAIVNAPSRRQKFGRRWSVLLLMVVAIGSAYLYFNNSSETNADQPLIATVSIGSIENTISSAGTLKPSNYVDVGAQVSGQLEKLFVEVGDFVEEGQLLAEIDARTQESRVKASRAAIEAQEAQIASREASLALARINVERQKQLSELSAISQLDYDTAISNLAIAEANLTQLQKQIAQARASLVSDETELEFARIYAPIAGTVVSIEMNEGRTLNANQQAPNILRLANLSTMTVEAEISEADIGNLEPGMSIYFTTLSGNSRRWRGELRQILPTPVIENNVVLYTGLFDVDNSDGRLLPEMTAQVFFVTSAARNVLTVPVAALTYIEREQSASSPLPAAQSQARGPRPNPGAFEQRQQRGERPSGATGRRPNSRAGGRNSSPRGETSARFAMVRVIGEDKIEEQRRVQVGITSRVSAEIVSGLEEGEQVVAGIVQGAMQQANNAQAGQRVRRFPGGF
ncbi:MAG: efflux RND transporter periplasmic adaptor subunit [Pseudohongiellaceae bacterium]